MHIIAVPIPKEKLFHSLDKLLKKHNSFATEEVMQSPEFASNGVAVPKEWVFPTVKCEFEGRKINIPREYKKYLELRYGSDYMQLPPENKRFNHRPVQLKF